MQSWVSAPVPALAGRGPELRLYDTSDRQVRPVAAGPTATMYVCGITPYDATHLGHAATYLTFDLIHRIWLDLGHQVHYVQNVTDVDDPLFERADRDGIDWRDLAAREVALYREDMAALRVLPPREYVAATEAVAEVVELVEKMLASGAAYVVDDAEFPDVYFRADATQRVRLRIRLRPRHHAHAFRRTWRRPGPRRARPINSMRCCGAPSGPANRVGRRRSALADPDGTSSVRRSRSAASAARLDIQGGGSDLIFPHHEFTAAHAESVSGERRFARHYVHAGMIGWDGHKMSKSRGNLVLVSGLRADGVEPAAIRLGLLAGHYRADRDWGPQVLEDAGARLQRWRAATGHCPRARTPPTSSPGCAAIWPTISIRPKRLPHLMVGLRRAGIRRPRQRGAGVVATVVDALLGVDLSSAR